MLLEIAMMFTLISRAFGQNQRIPPRFSRDGGNVSPPLQWRGAPKDTKSYALIVEDPDAPSGTFRHWALHDIPSSVTELAEGLDSKAGDRMHAAVNDFGDRHYDGPQPPPGRVHHYHFRLFALDIPLLKLPGNARAHDVLDAARAHSLAQADLVGTYER